MTGGGVLCGTVLFWIERREGVFLDECEGASGEGAPLKGCEEDIQGGKCSLG